MFRRLMARRSIRARLSRDDDRRRAAMRLKEKVAIVTGAASGIGKAIAQRFASEGAFVILADKNEGAIPAAIDEIRAAGGGAAGFAVDVADRGQVQAFMTKVVAAHGRVDILVNNAGITRHRPFLTMSDEDWNLVLDVDLKGVFFCVQADQVACANISETAVDDPDQMFYENYACASDRNHTGFCDKEVDALIDRQSAEPNAEKRRELVWGIERRLARDASRPIIFYTRAATCWRPRVKGLNLVVNSVFNSWRFEDVWLDR